MAAATISRCHSFSLTLSKRFIVSPLYSPRVVVIFSASVWCFKFKDTPPEILQLRSKSTEIDKRKLPPPYDPFNKKSVIEEPKDPKNLQEIFHKKRTECLINNAIKMFDALSKDGLTHEAMELFAQIKDKGNMPDVVAHTAVIEAYANAGQSKEALKVYMRMLASGIKPNAYTYTYTVLIKGLASDSKLEEANKYLLEMMDTGIRPNAATYTAVFEVFAREEKVEQGRELLEKMKVEGFVVRFKSYWWATHKLLTLRIESENGK